MKSFTTITAIAALIAGIAIANAQNAGGPAGPNASPGNINKGDVTSSPQSGNESGSTARKSGRAKGRVAGRGKFCIQVAKSSGGIECRFASMETCTKEAQPRGLQCSENPKLSTTGSRQ